MCWVTPIIGLGRFVFMFRGGSGGYLGVEQKERTHPDFRTPKVSISAILPPSFGLTSLS